MFNKFIIINYWKKKVRFNKRINIEIYYKRVLLEDHNKYGRKFYL